MQTALRNLERLHTTAHRLALETASIRDANGQADIEQHLEAFRNAVEALVAGLHRAIETHR